jgi:DNA-binding response OmpR family regulator
MTEKKQILIIDDERSILDAMATILRSAGYDVQQAESSSEALDKLRAFKPDLIFADIRMPDMNGFDLLENIKKIPSVSSTPVVFLSAIDDFHARKVARDLGAADYLLKPVDEKDVFSTITKHLHS